MAMVLQLNQVNEIAQILLSEELVILPTDTVYGIHCLANSSKLVSKINEVKKRPETMPFITLISDSDQVEQFGVVLNAFDNEQCSKYWPGANTLIFSEKSFRLPNNKFLIDLINLTGPLISTSANIHNQNVVINIQQAQQTFAHSIKYYVDGGELNIPPSSIYQISSNQITKIR